MARIRMQQIMESGRTEVRRALAAAVNEVIPDVEFDDRELFRAFVRAVGRKCGTWTTVADKDVES